jgi:hypothetical protein
MRFAHFKRILRLGRLRLRGPRGAQDEFVLAAIAQNLRRLAALVARPPPAEVSCALHCVESIRAGGSKPAAPNEMIDRPCNQLTFAIKSARNGHAAVVALCLLSGCKAENISRRSISPFDGDLRGAALFNRQNRADHHSSPGRYNWFKAKDRCSVATLPVFSSNCRICMGRVKIPTLLSCRVLRELGHFLNRGWIT